MTLTRTDLDAIRQLIELTLDKKLEEKLEVKLKEYIGHLPTKDEFFTSMDKLMAELQLILKKSTPVVSMPN